MMCPTENPVAADQNFFKTESNDVPTENQVAADQNVFKTESNDVPHRKSSCC